MFEVLKERKLLAEVPCPRIEIETILLHEALKRIVSRKSGSRDSRKPLFTGVSAYVNDLGRRIVVSDPWQSKVDAIEL